MKRVINISVNVLLVLMLLTVASLVLLRIVGYTSYTVKTPSMYPSCPVGTMIFVGKADFDDFSKGDIVTFKQGDSVITHRVYYVDEKSRTLVTKGDNNDIPDNVPITEENIVGRVEFYVPYIGFIYLLADSIYGKIVIASVFVFVAVLSVLTEKSEKDKKSGEHDSENNVQECDPENTVGD